MDSWNEKQIQMMRAGGNDKCINFLAQYNVPKSMAIAMKYNTPGILLLLLLLLLLLYILIHNINF